VTLLDILRRRFGAAIDSDSDAGQILGSLTPRPPFDDNALSGQADAAPLTFVPAAGGVRVRAAQGADMIVFSLPAGPLNFTIVPPDAAHPEPIVELKLLAISTPVPFLRPAQATVDGLLEPAGGQVELHLPNLLLVVTADPIGNARLAPTHAGDDSLEVTMTPPFALLGPGTTLGFGFQRANLKLDGPSEPEIVAPDVQIFVAPPGIPALAMHGDAHDLRIGLGTQGGVSGDFSLALAEGAPAAVARPDFLYQLASRLRLNRNAVTLLEVTGQIDVQDAVESRLGGPLGDPPGAGRLDFALSLLLDGGWRSALAVSPAGDRNYLWRTQNTNGGSPLRDTLGAYAVFAPLLAPNLPDVGSSGYVDLALGAGAASGLVAAGVVRTQSMTIHGVQLVVHALNDNKYESFLIFDLETELHVKAEVGGTELIATRQPLKVRHKAIGLRLDFGPNGTELKPIFDPSQGFSLDLSDPGIFKAPGSLGDIIQPQGARMARENPLNFEIDLVLKADLGVVAVDKASVRIPIDPPGPPSLTALGAHVDVPRALAGNGYLKLEDDGFSGSLDVALAPPLGVRVAAGLALQNVPGATAVLLTLGVELPVPIPLLNSGLGLFGFLGLFGMHYQRNQEEHETALEWFKRSAGNATSLAAWKPTDEKQWAFGLGAVLGTIEGGFLFHTKGMIIIELPGPRLLLVMNADILSPRPDTMDEDTGTLLAVMEISEHSLTIDLVVNYDMLKPLLEIHIPIEAFFNFDETGDWRLDVGTFSAPATVKYLFTLRGAGYLMLHGNGIPAPGQPPNPDEFPIGPLQGFSVAAGVRAALVWGSEDIGLYLKVAAQADVGISYKPFLVTGKMTLSGELHLFIAGIGVSASADVKLTPEGYYVYAQVCGRIEFFLLPDIEECITLEIGSEPQHLPPAEPLVRALSLHSRSPALLPGSAGDRPVDGSLGDAARITSPDNALDGEVPVVPIDVIPVLQLEMRPALDPECRVLGKKPDELDPKLPPKLPLDSWVRRGDRFYRYTLKSVTLTGVDANNQPLVSATTAGDAPVVWWDRKARPSGSEDNEVQLALLDWTPDATPAAAERTRSLDMRLQERWGQVCLPVARPANVLWSFRPLLVGPSASGWTLHGHPWPDDSNTWRSAPPDDALRVTEPWRSGNAVADALALAEPAMILGSPTVPDRLLVGPRTGTEIRPRVDGHQLEALLQALRPQPLESLADALRLHIGGRRPQPEEGLSFIRLLFFVSWSAFESGVLVLRTLDVAGNETGPNLPIDKANARLIQDFSDLPGEWTDPGSPWAATTQAVYNAWYHAYVGEFGEPPLVFLEAPLPAGAAQVEIGAIVDVEDFPDRYWGILLAEGATQGEMRRFQFDDEHRRDTIRVIDGALHHDDGRRALLIPGATYTLTAEYDVRTADVDDQDRTRPKQDENGFKLDEIQQRFQFKTDSAPPDRLDPWVLTTDPAPYQPAFFWGDPIRVVFATGTARKLYQAYGRELFARVRAASGKHPQQAPGFAPARVNLASPVVQTRRLPPVAMTPWESAIREMLADQPCLNLTDEIDRHEQIAIPLQLEPLTDYILDIEAEPTAGDPVHPLFRRHFTTSRYRDMPALAAAVAGSPTRHRRVADATPLAALGAGAAGKLAVVRDLDIEAALRAVRWGDLARPTAPQVTLIWQDGLAGDPPQPMAVLLEAPEALWRWRDVPVSTTDAYGRRRYTLQPAPWLEVAEAPAAVPVSEGFVSSAGGGRTLVLLRPNARGATLSLLLKHIHHPLFEANNAVETATLATVSLSAAPWEENQ